jgi:hypothetical protein
MKRQSELDALIEELRTSHWALREPLRYASVRQLLKDQRIPVTLALMPVPAMTTIQWGLAAIALSSSLRQSSQVAVLAEEYAHAMLHREEPGELTIHLSAFGAHDDREYEADYVARALLSGPGVDVAYFAPPKLTPARRPHLPRWPAWPSWAGPIPNPYADDYRCGISRPDPGSEGASLRRQPRIKPAAVRFKAAAAGTPRIVYDGLFAPPRYQDADGVRWQLRDATVDMRDRGIVRVEVDLGSPRALYRYFISSGGDRRVYRFAKWESRDIVLRRLTMQARESQVLTRRARRSDQERTG